MDVYLKKAFLAELSKRGISLTYKTLLRYERAGILARPADKWRLYTPQDIDVAEQAIRAFREARKEVNHDHTEETVEDVA